MDREYLSALAEQKGLQIKRYFTKEGISPFEMCNYERRTSAIRNPDGSAVFQMNDVEVPSFWTQVATDILAQKYFRKVPACLCAMRTANFFLMKTAKSLPAAKPASSR